MEEASVPKGIRAENVTRWIVKHLEDIEPPRFALIAGGHSNLTYEVVDVRGISSRS
jgi:hypothetical protein